MSLAEIKEEVRKLTPAERKELQSVIVELDVAPEVSSPRTREVGATDSEVPAAMDAVFDKHRELLRKLAQ